MVVQFLLSDFFCQRYYMRTGYPLDRRASYVVPFAHLSQEAQAILSQVPGVKRKRLMTPDEFGQGLWVAPFVPRSPRHWNKLLELYHHDVTNAAATLSRVPGREPALEAEDQFEDLYDIVEVTQRAADFEAELWQALVQAAADHPAYFVVARSESFIEGEFDQSKSVDAQLKHYVELRRLKCSMSGFYSPQELQRWEYLDATCSDRTASLETQIEAAAAAGQTVWLRDIDDEVLVCEAVEIISPSGYRLIRVM